MTDQPTFAEPNCPENWILPGQSFQDPLVAAPKDGCYSSFHRYGQEGIYPEDWGADGQVMVDSGVGRE